MKLGKVSEACLKRSVLRQIKTRREEVLSGAGIGADCAILSLKEGGKWAVCVQEAAVAMPGGSAEKAPTADGVQSEGLWGPEPVMTLAQLIQKSANNCAAGGAEPTAVLLTLLLPETAEEAELGALMAEAEKKCGELSLEIAGGQTRITTAVTMPVATITCLGRRFGGGENITRAAHGTRAAPGQDVVISKWIGLQGTALLAKRFRDRLLARYPAWLVDEAAGFERYHSILPEAAAAVKSGVCAMHDVSEGGIFGALWELAEGAGVGLTIDMKKLPLRQETVEVCECCNVNPYLLLSGGCLLMTAQDGPGLVSALAAEQIPAVVVGKVTDGGERILVNGDEIRYMDRPQTDEIWRIGG